MNKSPTSATKLSRNHCVERGCVVLDQPQHAAKVRCSGFLHALRLVCDTAALLSAALTTTSLLLLDPTCAHAQRGVPLWTIVSSGVVSALAVDNSGNLFVTGAAFNGANSDYATIKYSSAGVPLWTNI